MNDGVERMYKEAVLVHSMLYPMIYLKGMGKERKSSQKNRPPCSESNLCRHLLAVCLSNVGALTSLNPMGLHGL
jgi:hypothetical protein